MMSLIVPVVVVLAAVAALPRAGGRRAAFLVAALACGAWTVLGVELLSVWHGLTKGGLAAWWGIALAVAGVGAWRVRATWRRWVAGIFPRGIGRMEAGLIGLVGLLAAVVVVSAASSPPNNFDALDYHLPRQVRWAQDRSVAFFPANDPRLLHMPPFAEYVGVTLMVLSDGHDRWANLVQTAGLFVCLAAAALAVRELGGGRRGQLFAAALLVTCTPIFFQSSSPKNDVVLAGWLLVVLWRTLHVLRTRAFTLADAGVIGLAAGLALLTKGTAMVFGVPLAALAAVAVARARPVGKSVAGAAVVVVLVLAPNVPHWCRNWRTFGWPTGPHVVGRYSVQQYGNREHTPAVFVSNAVRNATIHLALPGSAWNDWLKAEVGRLHEHLGLGTSDPRTTYPGGTYDVAYHPSYEDHAGAPVHFLLLLLLAPLSLPASKELVAGWRYWTAVAVPLACAALFCLFVSWQPWHTRLQIPIFAFLAVPAGVLFETAAFRVAGPIVVAAAAIAVAPSVVDGPRTPFGDHSTFVTSRTDLLTAQFSWDRADFLRAVEFLRRCGLPVIGLHLEHGQYAAERLLMDAGGTPWRFVYPFARAVPPGGPPDPVADVLVTDLSSVAVLSPRSTGAVYLIVARSGRFAVYARRDLAARVPVDKESLAWTGIEAVSGLGEFEGPYPPAGLPRLRRGIRPATAFKFYAVANVPLKLSIRGRPEAGLKAIRATLDGKPLFDAPVGPPGRDGIGVEHTVTVSKTGIHDLVVAYESAGDPGGLLYFDIRLLADDPAVYGLP